MDSSMRDLEQIRETESEGEGRPFALVALLIGVTVALVLAMGVVVGGAPEVEEVSADDPLARLDDRAGLGPLVDPAEARALPDIDPSDLTFPNALAADERPEVVAALAAAAAELAHPDPLDDAFVAPPPAPVAAPLPAGMPAAIAAGPGELPEIAARDPLVAASLPAEPAGPVASAGREGEYTVQVISYDSPEGAHAFASGLQARGHHAFVARAEVDGRGTVWRVRVGPFETAREAQAYRREFERTEHMNTLLVRRPREET